MLAANVGVIAFEGWIEVIFNLPGNDEPNHSIKVPFLVSRKKLLRSILGFNEIQIKSLKGQCKLSQMKLRQWCIRAKKKTDGDLEIPVKIGSNDIVVQAGQMAHLKLLVPSSFNRSLAFFEVGAEEGQT